MLEEARLVPTKIKILKSICTISRDNVRIQMILGYF